MRKVRYRACLRNLNKRYDLPVEVDRWREFDFCVICGQPSPLGYVHVECRERRLKTIRLLSNC